MNRRPHRFFRAAASSAFVLTLLAGLGCAGTIPPTRELQAARTAYDRAQDHDAAQLAPDRLYSAQKALARAERAHDQEPGGSLEKQYAYIAQRLAETAAGQSALVRSQIALASANEEFERVRREATERELADTKRELTDQAYETSALEESLETTEKDLVAEQAARRAAEQQTKLLQQQLNELSKLRKSDEGMTLSLSGAVLFEFGKSTLLPSAERVLDRVAEALKDQQKERTIVVEGHTDSVGSDAANMALSKARAEAVRDYLVKKGVYPARIKAVGRGETDPVAANDNPERRAQNRRVEIIIGERNGKGRD